MSERPRIRFAVQWDDECITVDFLDGSGKSCWWMIDYSHQALSALLEIEAGLWEMPNVQRPCAEWLEIRRKAHE